MQAWPRSRHGLGASLLSSQAQAGIILSQEMRAEQALSAALVLSRRSCVPPSGIARHLPAPRGQMEAVGRPPGQRPPGGTAILHVSLIAGPATRRSRSRSRGSFSLRFTAAHTELERAHEGAGAGCRPRCVTSRRRAVRRMAVFSGLLQRLAGAGRSPWQAGVGQVRCELHWLAKRRGRILIRERFALSSPGKIQIRKRFRIWICKLPKSLANAQRL